LVIPPKTTSSFTLSKTPQSTTSSGKLQPITNEKPDFNQIKAVTPTLNFNGLEKESTLKKTGINLDKV
jgi:hypothetical protein